MCVCVHVDKSKEAKGETCIGLKQRGKTSESIVAYTLLHCMLSLLMVSHIYKVIVYYYSYYRLMVGTWTNKRYRNMQ